MLEQTIPTPKTKPISATVFPLLIFISGIVYFCMRILGSNLEYIPGDLGDSRFINFLLEHGHRWLTGKENSFWSAEFMYPFKNTIALSDNMIGTVPLYSFWRVLGFSFETAYQLWWLSICTLNFWLCHIVLRKSGLRPELAAMLSWIFAFSIFNIGQLNYMQMIIRFMVPVVFYASAKLVSAPSKKYLLLYCSGIIIQMYSVMYTGIYLFYFSLFFIAIYAIVSKQKKNLLLYFRKKQLYYTLAALTISAALLLLLLIPYYQMSKIVGLRMFRDVTPYLPTARSFLFPHESSPVWHFLHRTMNPGVTEYWLQYLFPGGILVVTLIAAPMYLLYMVLRKKKLSPLLSAAIIVSFVIALLHLRTEGELTLYALIFKLPGFNSMRVPIRFMHLELFLLVFILGFFLSRFKLPALLLFFALVFADNMFNPDLMPRTKKTELEARRENLTRTILFSARQNTNYKYIAVTDTTEANFITHLDAMIASQALSKKTINGYSSYCPDAYGEFFVKCNKEGLVKWAQDQRIPASEILIIDRNTGD